MKRAVIVPILAALALAGCGESAIHADLRKTASNLDEITSGTMTFSVLVTPKSATATHPFGFRLHGPFRFGDKPTGTVDYTQIANGSEATVTVEFGPTGGTVLSGGSRRTLSAAQLSSIRSAAASVRADTKNDIGNWLDTQESCGQNCVRGRLHVANTVVGLLGINGTDVTLSKDEAAALDNAGRSATYEVHWVGDHLLRDMKLHVALAFDVPKQLRTALGELVGATFDLHLGIANAKTS